MSSLRCLFIVQGEGRGHMTQALALEHILAEAGHSVEGVLLGRSERRKVPSFFHRQIDAAVIPIDSPNYVPDASRRAIRMIPTVWRGVRRTPSIYQSLRVIDESIKAHQPDLVVNFFEPLAGLYYFWNRPDVPMVCIGHQYMFEHPSYEFPPGRSFIRSGLKAFTRLTAYGASKKLALSLYPAEHLPEKNLRVMPPLLRRRFFELSSRESEPFVLAYLLNRGYAREIIEWHKERPDVELHCFWDHPRADEVFSYDDTLTFHRLDGEKFLSMMARCQGLATTAGFESVAEAMYLGKPVLMVPVEGHFEQFCNAIDGTRAGAGKRSSTFQINELLDYLPDHQPRGQRFRDWVEGAGAQAIQILEETAGLKSETAPKKWPVAA